MIKKARVESVDALQNYIDSRFASKLESLADYENLDLEDALHYKNWGYDEEEQTFKCLDYGICFM